MKKFLASFLAILMLLLALSGCNAENEEAPTEKPTEAATNAPVATAKTIAKVIYPAGSNYKKAALKIQDKIIGFKGSSLENMSLCTLGTDDKTAEDGTFEILLGLTNRAISADAKALLKTYLDFSVVYKDNKLAIYANNESAMLSAVEYVLGKLSLKDDKVIYSGSETYVENYSEYQIPDFKIASTSLSEFSIVYPASNSAVEKSYALSLADWMMSMTGISIKVVDDSAAEVAHEILIGKTNRAQSTTDKELQSSDYMVDIVDGKLVISAGSKAGYDMSLTAFKNAMSKNEGSLDKGFGVRTLSFDEIKAISVGSPNIKIEDGALCFYKATDEQMEAYGAPGTGMRNNATGSTGVRLDFVTDSSMFSFKAAAGNRYELYINGEFKQQITNAAAQTFSIALDTSKGENRITLFLPNGGVGKITMMQLDYGATCERQKFDRNFLIIGDSITQAWPTTIDSNGYGHLISMHYNADSIVYGVGGGIFDAKILGSTPECDPEVITVAFGTNDWARSYTAATIENNMRAFLNKLKELYPDAKIVGITPLWRKDADNKKAITFDEARDLIKSIYEEYGISCIDGEYMMGHDDKFFADDVHPNDEGHKEYANNLIKELDVILG